jgi:hypothetical protein
MADDLERIESGDDRTYEPPAVEPLGSADELAKGNEGSTTDTAVG